MRLPNCSQEIDVLHIIGDNPQGMKCFISTFCICSYQTQTYDICTLYVVSTFTCQTRPSWIMATAIECHRLTGYCRFRKWDKLQTCSIYPINYIKRCNVLIHWSALTISACFHSNGEIYVTYIVQVSEMIAKAMGQRVLIMSRNHHRFCKQKNKATIHYILHTLIHRTDCILCTSFHDTGCIIVILACYTKINKWSI